MKNRRIIEEKFFSFYWKFDKNRLDVWYVLGIMIMQRDFAWEHNAGKA
jgi:hypothetical protein